MHVFGFVGGCYVGHKYSQWERALAEDVNNIRQAKGLPPMVGSYAWKDLQSSALAAAAAPAVVVVEADDAETQQ